MSLHAVDALTFVGSQEDRCEIRYNMLYGEGEPEFEIILSTYVYAYSHEATFLLLVHVLMLHVLMLHACLVLKPMSCCWISGYGVCTAHPTA